MSENVKFTSEYQEKNISENKKPLFTRSRILFLISVFIVFLMPLAYRYLIKFI
jgi:hypothetical protein